MKYCCFWLFSTLLSYVTDSCLFLTPFPIFQLILCHLSPSLFFQVTFAWCPAKVSLIRPGATRRTQPLAGKTDRTEASHRPIKSDRRAYRERRLCCASSYFEKKMRLPASDCFQYLPLCDASSFTESDELVFPLPNTYGGYNTGLGCYEECLMDMIIEGELSLKAKAGFATCRDPARVFFEVKVSSASWTFRFALIWSYPLIGLRLYLHNSKRLCMRVLGRSSHPLGRMELRRVSRDGREPVRESGAKRPALLSRQRPRGGLGLLFRACWSNVSSGRLVSFW